MSNINQQTIFMVDGASLTFEDFKNKFGIVDDEQALKTAIALVKKNKILVKEVETDEDVLMNKANKELELQEMVDAILLEEDNAKTIERQSKIDGKDLLDIELTFTSSAQAIQAEQWINSIGIENTSVTIKKGVFYLAIKQITPQEYTKIARKYKLDKTIETGVKYAEKAVMGTTDMVNYAATKVVAPSAKILGKAGLNIGKGLVHTGAKVGASLVNNTVKAGKETKEALRTDTELIKAKKELIDVKDSVFGKFKKMLNPTGKTSGINITNK